VNDKALTCAFTGYRPSKLHFGFDEDHPDCENLKQSIYSQIEILIEDGYKKFISGMALGVDIWAAEAILQLKILHPDIFLECALPCETQANKWNSADRERYFNILAASNKVTYISYQYTKDCIFKHNKYIVDNCDTLIAAFDGQKGGIAYTVNYASENNKQIIIINPKTGKIIPYLRVYGS
jgi:uncharacterized phage-like protein YoqJ